MQLNLCAYGKRVQEQETKLTTFLSSEEKEVITVKNTENNKRRQQQNLNHEEVRKFRDGEQSSAIEGQISY